MMIGIWRKFELVFRLEDALFLQNLYIFELPDVGLRNYAEK